MEAHPEPTLADDEAQLAAFAEQLIEQVDTAIGGWVTRSVFGAAGAGGVAVVEDDLAAVIEKTRVAAMPEIRGCFEPTWIPAQAARSQRCGTPPVDLLTGGSGRPPTRRVRTSVPRRPYQLGPAAFSDVDEDLHEPGLVGRSTCPRTSPTSSGVRSWLTMSLSPEIDGRQPLPVGGAGVVIVRSVDALEIAGARIAWSLRSASISPPSLATTAR